MQATNSQNLNQDQSTQQKTNNEVKLDLKNIIQSDDIPLKEDNTNNNAQKQQNIDPNLTYAYFLFVNPSSGGNKASILTNLKVEYMQIQLNDPSIKNQNLLYNVQVSIYNLTDTENKTKGMNSLKQAQQKEGVQTQVIVGGGDGTIMWVIQEMCNFSINIEKCPIGTIPFGTGNDFARVLGWGGSEPSSLLGVGLADFKKLVWKWLHADIQNFDIWETKVELYETGSIQVVKKINQTVQKVPLQDEQKRSNLLAYTKKMSNYFSIGVDARVGIGFDKNRTSSRLCNKVVYCWEGFKKMFIKTAKINKLIDSIFHSHHIPDQPQIQSIEDQSNTIITTLNKEQIQALKEKDERYKNKLIQQFKGEPSCLLAVNIPSYAAGGSDPWKSSRGKQGVIHQDNLKAQLQFSDQDFGDGKLEFVAFPSMMSIAQERMINGRSQRVAQGPGPYQINFKNPEEFAKQRNQNNNMKTYLNIDGEYFILNHPKSINLSLTKSLPNGKIKVLVNQKKKVQIQQTNRI